MEKYGYLECVPPGSEGNTHLHRLLLYRAQRYIDTPRYHPLDFRLTDTDMYEVPPDRYQYDTGRHVGRVEGVLGQDPVPQEDLDVPSVRQDLLAVIGNSRRRSTPSEWQQSDGKETRLTVAVWDPITNHLQHLPVCTQTEIQEAVKKFQVNQTYKYIDMIRYDCKSNYVYIMAPGPILEHSRVTSPARSSTFH